MSEFADAGSGVDTVVMVVMIDHIEQGLGHVEDGAEHQHVGLVGGFRLDQVDQFLGQIHVRYLDEAVLVGNRTVRCVNIQRRRLFFPHDHDRRAIFRGLHRIERMIGVTGGASGLGFALGEALLARGANVVLADIEQEALNGALKRLESYDNRVSGLLCDVSDESAFQQVAAQAIERLGKVHFVFNNAGVGGGGALAEIPNNVWNWVLGVNFMGVVHGIQAFLPHLREHGEDACIVNTASMAGMIAMAGMGPYCASKFAVVAVTEALAGELAGSAVHAAVLCPGFVRTRIGESRRNRPFELEPAPPTPEQQLRMQAVAQMIETGLDPDVVAERVLEAVAEDQLYIFTHPEFAERVDERFERIRAGFESARRSAALKPSG